MIQRSELGWTQEGYDAFLAATGDPTYSVTLEAYSLAINTTTQSGVGTETPDRTIDAIVCDDTIIRVWNGAGQIHVGRLASEDGGDQDWTESTLTAANLDESVSPSLAIDGNSVRVFWYDGENIRYFESTDEGASWGTAQTVTAVSEVAFIAATSLTRIHYLRRTDQDNLLFGVCESGTATDSAIYWPLPVTSFDAVPGNHLDDFSAAENDVIGFTTDFPPLVAHRVDGTELVKYLERVQGIAFVRYQNGRWSHHVTFDLVDNVPTTLVPARDNLRLTRYGGWLFATYLRKSGSANYPHEALAVTRSKTGLHWEMPYLLQAGAASLFLKRGNHVYLVDSTGKKARSDSVGYVDDVAVTHDLSDYVLSIAITSGDIKEVQVTLANPGGALDAILDQDRMWRVRVEQGYYVDDAPVMVQTILADLERISRPRELPSDHRVLVGRNALGRMTTLRADLVQEWENQQMGGDNFQSLDGTKYSGLRHTAGYAGHWEAHDNVLQLRSGSTPGIAFNLHTSNVWNGSAQMAIKVARTDSDDFAGLIFRGLDKYNFWYVAYDADEDQLVLCERKDNVDANHAGQKMSWSAGAFYWIKVAYAYNHVTVYSAADGVTWSLVFDCELPGVPSTTPFTFGNIPLMRGSMGYVGHGYSEYNPGYPAPPWTPPPIDLPGPETPAEWPTEMYVGTRTNGIYHSTDFGPPTDPMPTWSLVNEGITDLDELIWLLLDPFAQSYRQYCLVRHSGGEGDETVYRRENQGNWTSVLTTAQADTLTGGTGLLTCIAIDRQNAGHLWALWKTSAIFQGETWLLKSTDYGANWSAVLVNDSEAYHYQAPQVQVSGNLICVGASHGAGGSGHYHLSRNGGLSWETSDPDLGLSVWDAWVHLNALTINPYVNGNDTGGPDLCEAISDAWDVVQDAHDVGPPRPDAMWLSAEEAGFHRIIKGDRIYATDDGWDSITIGALLSVTGMDSILAPVRGDEDMLFFGRATPIQVSPEHVYISDDEGDTLIPRSGPMPDEDPFTDSIPYDAGGICYDGVQPVVE